VIVLKSNFVFFRALVVTAGKVLYIYRLDSHLIEVTHMTTHFDITSVDTHGANIVVGSQKDSLSYYKYNSILERLEFLRSDQRSRSTAHAIMIDDTMSVASDKFGCIYGLSFDEATESMNNNLCDIFNFHYPESFSRLRTSRIVIRTPNKHDLDVIGWDGAGLDKAGRFTVVIGCSLVGSSIMLLRLSEVEKYNILKALQDALEDSNITRPLLGNSNVTLRSFSRLNLTRSMATWSLSSFVYDVTSKSRLSKRVNHCVRW